MGTELADLYQRDFYTWTRRQAEALRRAAEARVNTPEALDWANVAEEIESMGREQAAKLRSSYRVLLMHLLKWQFQPNLQSRGWRATIARERGDAVEHLMENPGLKPRQEELFAAAYRRARKEAAVETGLLLKTFPETCPFTIEQALDDDFWPGVEDEL